MTCSSSAMPAPLPLRADLGMTPGGTSGSLNGSITFDLNLERATAVSVTCAQGGGTAVVFVCAGTLTVFRIRRIQALETSRDHRASAGCSCRGAYYAPTFPR